MKTKKFYNCFSYKQHEYLRELGFTPVTRIIHHETQKTIWVYSLSKTLSVALKAWSLQGKMFKLTKD